MFGLSLYYLKLFLFLYLADIGEHSSSDSGSDIETLHDDKIFQLAVRAARQV